MHLNSSHLRGPPVQLLALDLSTLPLSRCEGRIKLLRSSGTPVKARGLLGSLVVPFCPFYFGAPLLQPNSRKKGILITTGLLGNLECFLSSGYRACMSRRSQLACEMPLTAGVLPPPAPCSSGHCPAHHKGRNCPLEARLSQFGAHRATPRISARSAASVASSTFPFTLRVRGSPSSI